MKKNKPLLIVLFLLSHIFSVYTYVSKFKISVGKDSLDLIVLNYKNYLPSPLVVVYLILPLVVYLFYLFLKYVANFKIVNMDNLFIVMQVLVLLSWGISGVLSNEFTYGVFNLLGLLIALGFLILVNIYFFKGNENAKRMRLFIYYSYFIVIPIIYIALFFENNKTILLLDLFLIVFAILINEAIALFKFHNS